MIYMICYDISDPKRLRRAAKTLENYGLRVQYSFFQCDMPRKIMEQVRDDLLEIINTEEDYLFIYPLCELCTKKAQTDGEGSLIVLDTFEII